MKPESRGVLILSIVLAVVLIGGGFFVYWWMVRETQLTNTNANANVITNTVANQNANANLNTNLNANVNTNVATNTNANMNTNANTNTAPLTISYSNASADDIVITGPTAGARITSPLTVTGRARGSWFFEASAPVTLVDWDGRIIAEGTIQTTGDWMTSEFVDFTGTLTFTKPSYGETGAVIFKNDNPSGLPANDKSAEVPIKF
jgi:hypothetical protein